MGGAVSSGESNDDLIDNLLEADYIKSPLVERVFRAVDRAFYYTEPYKQNAYKDLAWKDGNLHLSAPCIYSEVLENLDLRSGMCFLNIGSGTGYFSTMCGLILGKTGVNHGIELYPDVVFYAKMKLEEFMRSSPAIDEFDFCLPEFTVGNCLDSIPCSKRYDRIYCGAACPNNFVGHLVDMLKIGGICVVPLGDSLVQITRTEEKNDERKALLPVSFASLISPSSTDSGSRTPIELPDWSPKSLTDLCRYEIRSALRQTITLPEPKSMAEENRKKKRKRRQNRRRASRLVVVQRRRSGGDADGENGFVAIAYSMNSNSSDEDRHQEGDPEQNQEENVANGSSSEDSSREGEASPQQSEHEDGDTIMDELTKKDDDENTVPSLESNASTSSSVTTGESSASRNGVAVVTGSCPVHATSNVKKAETGNGSRNDDTRRPERRSTSASSTRVRPTATSNGRPTRSARSGAETLLGRIRELVRARQVDLESMRRQFHRNGSETENEGRSRSSNRDDASTAEVPSANGNGVNSVHSDVTTSSESSPSPSASATSTSDDETGGENQSDNSKKRCRNESGEDEKKMSAKEPKPDPLLVNPCSVQMRKKILDLPLPPALKVYLNYDRKLIHY